MTKRQLVYLSAILAVSGGALASAAETDRLILKDGRVLVGEVLGDDDSNVVRFAMGSSIQEMPRRLVKQVRRGSDADQPTIVRTAAPAPTTVIYQQAPPTTVVYQQVPVCVQPAPVYVAPVYASPACRPYVSSGWSLSYSVGSSWSHGRHSGWGLGWTYGVGSRPGWCAPSPWCR